MASTEVAVLYARSNSIYNTIDGVDVWDKKRDARLYRGNYPVIAHPPCGQWGRLRQFAIPNEEEKAFAIHAVNQVRRCGGVLEHPRSSTLWEAMKLPLSNQVDEYGGWTMGIKQGWAGHNAIKSTWLYIVGCEFVRLPGITFETNVVANKTVNNMGRAEREATPRDLALWLVELAKRCRGDHHARR